jgi:hypothetical protein
MATMCVNTHLLCGIDNRLVIKELILKNTEMLGDKHAHVAAAHRCRVPIRLGLSAVILQDGAQSPWGHGRREGSGEQQLIQST